MDIPSVRDSQTEKSVEKPSANQVYDVNVDIYQPKTAKIGTLQAAVVAQNDLEQELNQLISIDPDEKTSGVDNRPQAIPYPNDRLP